jgi:N6-adenosine-specific RNA methylase IME4
VWPRDTGMDRHAANHYPVSKDAHSPEEIVERTKDRFACAAPDCLLAMWSTVQHLAIALEVMKLRGFDYVSHYVWAKDRVGLGFWNRNKHEILLLGVKGNIPCPAPGTQWDSLITAPVSEHSAKPECFLEMIEAYFPNLPKIELNARTARPGWRRWGLDAPVDDEGDSGGGPDAIAGGGDGGNEIAVDATVITTTTAPAKASNDPSSFFKRLQKSMRQARRGTVAEAMERYFKQQVRPHLADSYKVERDMRRIFLEKLGSRLLKKAGRHDGETAVRFRAPGRTNRYRCLSSQERERRCDLWLDFLKWCAAEGMQTGENASVPALSQIVGTIPETAPPIKGVTYVNQGPAL